MNKQKSHIELNKSQRNGIFVLLIIIVLLQSVWFFLKNQPTKIEVLTKEQIAFQKQIDSLRSQKSSLKKDTIYPFNPNYLNDYKGYILGMTPEQITRFLEYRKIGKSVNSAEEFQQISEISDSLLSKIRIYLKFPEWTRKKQKQSVHNYRKSYQKSLNVAKKDINTATVEDLREVRGIGEVLSKRIVKYRTRLQGFSQMSQLYEVFGIEEEVIDRVLERFEIQSQPKIQKININLATMSELAKIPYLNYKEARAVVIKRSEVGNFSSEEQLMTIEGFSKEKINRILLYLSFDTKK